MSPKGPTSLGASLARVKRLRKRGGKEELPDLAGEFVEN